MLARIEGHFYQLEVGGHPHAHRYHIHIGTFHQLARIAKSVGGAKFLGAGVGGFLMGGGHCGNGEIIQCGEGGQVGIGAPAAIGVGADNTDADFVAHGYCSGLSRVVYL